MGAISPGGTGGMPDYSTIPGEDDASAPAPAASAPAPAASAPPAAAWTFDPRLPDARGPLGADPLAALLRLPPPDYTKQGSDRLRVLTESALGGVDVAALKDTSSPQTRLLSTIQALSADAMRTVVADEAAARKLPLDSPARRALEDRIDARVGRFEKEVAIETLKTAGEVRARAGGDKSAFERFKASLPAYLQESIAKEGAVIPGVPGSFKPRTDNGTFGGPTGLDYKVDF